MREQQHEEFLRAVRAQVQNALAEDIGGGDLSAPLAAAAEANIKSACLICRDTCGGTVICGAAWFEECFRQLDANASFAWQVKEGEVLPPPPPPLQKATAGGRVICRMRAAAAALLAGERTALNFMQLLSAVATATRQWQTAAGDKVKIVDTRKTVPLLRQAQKYAVRAGGGVNHRQGLYDEILIKENHIRAGGGIAAALQKAQKICAAAGAPPPQIEVRNIAELRQAAAAGATRVLLDNFSVPELKQAVAESSAAGAIELEASGGITLQQVPAVAACGVARISSGALTKNIQAVDFSFLLDEENGDNNADN